MIESIKNPKVKYVNRLRHRRFRDEEKRFLIEGYRELLRASEGGVCLKLLFICPELFLGENEQALIDYWKSMEPIFFAAQSLFLKNFPIVIDPMVYSVSRNTSVTL